MNEDLKVLKEFLKIPISSSDGVFDKFLELPGAIFRGEGKERFLYVPGKRTNKVLLVAHADTVWDSHYLDTQDYEQKLIFENDIIQSGSTVCGIGADDRSGCAILSLLKDMGHSLLITDGEEHGSIGSEWLMTSPENRDIADLINQGHQFIVQFDRRNGKDFKCYNVGTDEFRAYISEKTGYTEPDRSAGTDIVELCRNITGVNLSVGYHNEHSEDEYLDLKEWHNTLELCRKWLSEEDLPRFTKSNSRKIEVVFKGENGGPGNL